MADKPNVALVHDHLVQDGGAERVLRSLMRIYPDAPVYTFVYDAARMGPDFAGKDIRTSRWQKLPGATRFYRALLPWIDGAFRRFDLSQYDVVISSASGWAKSVRTNPKTVHICYCHTPTRYIWSDSARYVSEELSYPATVKWLIRRFIPKWQRTDRRAAAGVDQFIANSTYVAERIKRYYGRDATVINPPVDISQFSPSATKEDYYLVATRLKTYKRVDQAIAAANQLQVPLKVMGDGDDRPRLEQLAGPTVEFVGRVSDDQRKTLFASARALLNPQEEDFGITAVEALASGTPVIAYGAGGAAEIITDGQTGILYRPQTAEALAGAMARLQPADFDPTTLRRRAEDFAEPRFAAAIREFVDWAQAKT